MGREVQLERFLWAGDILGMRVPTCIEDYFTFPVEEAVIIIVGE